MENTIIRQERRSHFTIVPNELLNDPRLSWKAKGILCYLLSKPDGWKAQTNDIARHGTDGREAILSGIRELIDLGYAERAELRTNGKIEGRVLIIRDFSQIPQAQASVLPPPGNPTLVNPPLENASLSNTEISKTECTNTISKKFTVPDLREIQLHSHKIGLPEAEGVKFYWYQVSKGWRVGNAPMKSWQAAMQTWKRNWEERAHMAFAENRTPTGKPREIRVEDSY